MERLQKYREAIRLDPKLAEAHVNIATALQGKGDLDGAIARIPASDSF